MNDKVNEAMSPEALLKGKENMEARHKMAAEDESKILKESRAFHAVVLGHEPNWALYNLILSSVDFKDCKTMAEGMRKMYKCLWPHIRRYHNDRTNLLNHHSFLPSEHQEDSLSELQDIPSPMAMAEATLGQVTEAARTRAKLKRYGVVANEKKIFKG